MVKGSGRLNRTTLNVWIKNMHVRLALNELVFNVRLANTREETGMV